MLAINCGHLLFSQPVSTVSIPWATGMRSTARLYVTGRLLFTHHFQTSTAHVPKLDLVAISCTAKPDTLELITIRMATTCCRTKKKKLSTTSELAVG
jgi:hypothetical protein